MNTKVINLESILELYNQGLQPIEIGEKLGYSNSTVLKYIRSAGIIYKRDYSKHRRNRLGRHLINENFFEYLQIHTFLKILFLLDANPQNPL